jgi:hypothetical protein
MGTRECKTDQAKNIAEAYPNAGAVREKRLKLFDLSYRLACSDMHKHPHPKITVKDHAPSKRSGTQTSTPRR